MEDELQRLLLEQAEDDRNLVRALAFGVVALILGLLTLLKVFS